jgi:hypothetical protein
MERYARFIKVPIACHAHLRYHPRRSSHLMSRPLRSCSLLILPCLVSQSLFITISHLPRPRHSASSFTHSFPGAPQAHQRIHPAGAAVFIRDRKPQRSTKSASGASCRGRAAKSATWTGETRQDRSSPAWQMHHDGFARRKCRAILHIMLAWRTSASVLM